MFASDYPLFAYERLFADWHTLGYDDKVTERIFHGNAAALLDRLAR
jgi:predicted TIM-barrel fold metal-dependent hydrolase